MTEKKQEGTHVEIGRGTYVGRDVRVGSGKFVGGDDRSGAGAEELGRLFAQVYAAIAARPDTTPELREDLQAEVQEVEAEVSKGEEADEGFLARRLRNIERMAPDILEVILATVASPAAGLATVVRKVMDKMKGASPEAAQG